MDRAGDQLLAGAALAGDQHRRGGAGDLRDERLELLHRRVAADDLVAIVRPLELGAKERDLALERPPLERAASERQQLFLLERLREVVERAELHGGHRGPHGLDGGDQDDLDPFVDRLDALEHFDPVHAGQSDVEQHEVDLGSAGHIERPRAVRDVEHVVVIFENQPERLSDAGVVVNDQDDRARHPRTLAPIAAASGRVRSLVPRFSSRSPRGLAFSASDRRWCSRAAAYSFSSPPLSQSARSCGH